MKTIVDCIERHAINRTPSSLVCDGCGKKVRFESRTFQQELQACKEQGWVINSTWHGQDTKDYCPGCLHLRRR